MSPLAVLAVLGEEVKKRALFVGNAHVEEVPRRCRVGYCAQRVVQQHLRSDGEIEPARVGGMSEETRGWEEKGVSYAYKPLVNSWCESLCSTRMRWLKLLPN